MYQKQNPNKTYSTKKGNRKRQHFLFVLLLIIFCVIIGCFFNKINSLLNYDWKKTSPISEKANSHKIPQNLSINSSNAILIDLENEEVLFDKNSERKMYPASMTKIMTAIIVLEHIKDLEVNISLNNDMFDYLYYENASMAGFLPKEKVSAIDLLYGLLLPSGAECAIGLAEHISGSESAFVDLMNEKAKEIGMNSTHFTNTTGLHDENHYSTVNDISVLLKYALKNDIFYEIFTSSRHSTLPTNRHDDGITCFSSLFSRIDSPNFKGGYIIGGKTGYTPEAGQCLASLAIKNERYYILVTSGADGDSRTQKFHIDDAFIIYDAIYK